MSMAPQSSPDKQQSSGIAAEKTPAKQAANPLGISRTVYAAGYSAKDAAIWFGAIFVTLFTAITLGRKSKIPAIASLETKLTRAYNGVKAAIPFIAWAESKFVWAKAKASTWIEPAVVGFSFTFAYFACHLFMAPGAVRGWKKASAAIDQYNVLSEEKDQLVKTNEVLQKENELLAKKLALQEGCSHTDRARASQSTGNGMSF